MKKQTLPLFFTLLLSLLFLSACVPDLKINFKKEPTTSTSKKKTFKKSSSSRSTSSNSSSDSSSSPSTTTQSSSNIVTTEGLPKNAQEAPKDKIYATGNLKVTYSRNGDNIFAQTPDYEGYTTALVQKILGNPEKQITDPTYIAESFENTELENIKGLYHEGKITGEQAHAFLMGAVDLKQASKFGVDYTIYTYKNNTIQLVFENDQLLYITPNPDVVFFK
ncbi:putative lipoprotein [Streptococcus parasanguinis]|nr:putative lipoprotein [Streptococcus parasanguinis]